MDGQRDPWRRVDAGGGRGRCGETAGQRCEGVGHLWKPRGASRRWKGSAERNGRRSGSGSGTVVDGEGKRRGAGGWKGGGGRKDGCDQGDGARAVRRSVSHEGGKEGTYSVVVIGARSLGRGLSVGRKEGRVIEAARSRTHARGRGRKALLRGSGGGVTV